MKSVAQPRGGATPRPVSAVERYANREALALFLTQLKLDGYTFDAVLPEAAATDGKACAQSTCRRCGTRGLVYHGRRHPERASYRAVAECPTCGAFEEF